MAWSAAYRVRCRRERPWTIAMPLTHDPRPVMAFECHEGNYGLVNILKAARAADGPARRNRPATKAAANAPTTAEAAKASPNCRRSGTFTAACLRSR